MKNIDFAENLKNLRKNENISRKKLAEMLYISYRTVVAWETTHVNRVWKCSQKYAKFSTKLLITF